MSIYNRRNWTIIVYWEESWRKVLTKTDLTKPFEEQDEEVLKQILDYLLTIK